MTAGTPKDGRKIRNSCKSVHTQQNSESKMNTAAALKSRKGGRVDPMCLLSPQQREFASRFATQGYQGVREYVMEIARREDPQKTIASWKKILEADAGLPGKQDDVISRYLAGMDHSVLQALIEGTIARKAASEDTRFRYVLHWLNQLSGHPCTYINVPCRSEFAGEEYNTQGSGIVVEPSPWVGYGRSPHELEVVCDTMLRYLKVTDATTEEEARKIDMAFAPVADKDRPEDVATTESGRRYLVSAKGPGKIRVWVDAVRRTVIDPARLSMTVDQFKEPLPWSFQEIGFGVKGMRRAHDHLTHEGTNYLFGLYTSVLRLRFGPLFVIKQWCLNLVARPEEADAAEILGSVVGGTYHQGCGLNPHLAGGANLKGKNAINRDDWAFMYEEVRQKLAGSKFWNANCRIDEEKQERLTKALGTAKALPQRRADLEDMKRVVVEGEGKVAEKGEQIRVLEEGQRVRSSLKEVLRRAKDRQTSLAAPGLSSPSQREARQCVGDKFSLEPSDDGAEREMPGDAQDTGAEYDLPPPAKKLRRRRVSSPEVLVERSD